MADDIQIKFGADIGDALDAVNQVKDAIAGVAQPVAQVKAAYASLADAQTAAAAAAYRTAVQNAAAIQRVYGQVFDKIGSDMQHALSTALFDMPAPRTTYSSVMGANGRLLMEPHRESGTSQVLGGLERSVGTDLMNSITGGLSKSLATSIFGAGTQSFGQGIAKMLGIGGPGGLLGTGLGAVSNAATASTQMAATTLNTTSLDALTTAVAANTAALTGATAASTASAAGSVSGGTLSAVGGAGSAIGGLGFIGKAISWVGGLFAEGGIVPAAAGGWALPRSFGSDTVPAMLTPGEMVLPRNLSEGFQKLLSGGEGNLRDGASGGDMHLHLHNQGPMDGPGMERWFAANKYNIAKALGRIRSFG